MKHRLNRALDVRPSERVVDVRLRDDVRRLAEMYVGTPPVLSSPDRIRPRRHRMILGAVVGLALGGGSVGLAASLMQRAPAGTSTSPGGITAPPIRTSFPANAAGQTYGDPNESVAFDDYPDLILVQATNGMMGYVERHQLDEVTGANVSSPEEAVEWQLRQDAAGKGETLIPVYESDGVTVIGEFPVSSSQTLP